MRTGLSAIIFLLPALNLRAVLVRRVSAVLLAACLFSGCSSAWVNWEDSGPRAGRQESAQTVARSSPANTNSVGRRNSASSPVIPVQQAAVASASPQSLAKNASHQVQPGDTLYSIAYRYRIDVNALAKINGLVPPYTLYPGETLMLSSLFNVKVNAQAQQTYPTLPRRSVIQIQASELEDVSPSSNKGLASSAGDADVRHTTKTIPESPVIKGSSANSMQPVRAPQWQWPHSGVVLTRFSNQHEGRSGIDIKGSRGDLIRAAAAGKVVYSGAGLARYGKLIIVKHSEDYLSAYAYNRSLLAKEGDTIRAGQGIAEMGMGPKGSAMLHFEIRVKGEPIDPMQFLPAK